MYPSLQNIVQSGHFNGINAKLFDIPSEPCYVY